jgi:arylsulfatase A-like enzyme
MRAALLACLFVATACSRERPGIPPQHLLLVTCETLRADRTSAYLAARPTTSLAASDTARREGRALDLDHLAASGVLFATCTSPSPRTVPALASLFTGVSPRAARVEREDDRIPSDTPTLAELFRASGFRTGAFATRSRAGDLEASLARGFEEFRVSENDAETLAAALEWFKRDPGDGSRRFTWIHLAGAAPPFDRGTQASDVVELLDTKDFGAGLSPEELRALGAKSFDAHDEKRLAAFANSYDRAVARTSLGLTRLLQDAFDYTRPDAEPSETWARTVFAFTAPNGLLLGEDGLAGRADRVHEGTIHVPLVLRHPDSLTGERVSSAVVELADLLPTFVEWFDLKTPARVEGRSLLALLDSYVERPFAHRPAVARVEDAWIGVRDERWHLVLEGTATGFKERLHEPARDPAERDDVSAQHPDVVRRLAARARGAAAGPE